MATHGTVQTAERKPLYKSLFFQVVVALMLGIIVGAVWPDFAQALKPLGDGFIKLIKMIIAPIVFCVVVLGIAQAGDLKKVGRVGIKAVLYFEIVTTFALLIGVILAYALQPGVGRNIDRSTLDAVAG
jgi:aerobic C4-dicarboxylate transport protein